MYCRGHECRVKLAEAYDITPVAHLVLLYGQTKKSDAEAIIENEYYVFKTKKISNKYEESIICGMGAARDLLNITKKESLPIFNPLRQPPQENHSKMKNKKNKENIHKKNEATNELYNAIMWIIMLIDANSNSTIYKIKEEVEYCITLPPSLRHIKGINTIILKCFNGKSLTSKIIEYQEKNDIRENMFDFTLLTNELDNNKITSYF